MPFDPRIVPGDDARFEERELELPDDLVLLSEQLRDDAHRLSASYPPGKTASVALPATSQIARRRWKGRLAMGSLASGLVALSLLVGLSIYGGRTEVEPEGPSSPPASVAVEVLQPGFVSPAFASAAADVSRRGPSSCANVTSRTAFTPPDAALDGSLGSAWVDTTL